MSAIKNFLETVSDDLGYDGRINDEVLREAEKRMEEQSEDKEN